MRSNGAVAVRAMTPASPPAAAMREPSSTWIRRETGAGGSSADQAAVRSLPEQTACALRQCACHILHDCNALRQTAGGTGLAVPRADGRRSLHATLLGAAETNYSAGRGAGTAAQAPPAVAVACADSRCLSSSTIHITRTATTGQTQRMSCSEMCSSEPRAGWQQHSILHPFLTAGVAAARTASFRSRQQRVARHRHQEAHDEQQRGGEPAGKVPARQQHAAATADQHRSSKQNLVRAQRRVCLGGQHAETGSRKAAAFTESQCAQACLKNFRHSQFRKTATTVTGTVSGSSTA